MLVYTYTIKPYDSLESKSSVKKSFNFWSATKIANQEFNQISANTTSKVKKYNEREKEKASENEREDSARENKTKKRKKKKKKQKSKNNTEI